MADKKISQLTSAAPAIGTDELPINRAGTSGKLTITQITAIEKAERVAADGALPSLTTTNKSNLVAAINEVNTNVAGKMPLSYLDIDPLLAANSDTKVASQKAVKAYITSVLPTDATETIKGIAEIATQAETNTGTDDTRFITPLKLKVNLDSKNYFQGILTGNVLPLYNSVGAVLADSAIRQTSTGGRILLNGISDDLSSGLQVNGSIRQTTVTTRLTAFDTNGKLVDGGSGNSGYISKFSGSGNFLGNSLIQDDGTTLGFNIAPSATTLINTYTNTSDIGIYVQNSKATNTTYAGSFLNNGVKANPNIGLLSYALNSTTQNIGINGRANNATIGENIGGYFNALNGANNYSLRLTDGTEGSGKFLKSVTADGKANWANITAADVTGVLAGSGTLNYVSKWGSGTLTDSSIQDNGTSLSIGTAINAYTKLLIANTSLTTTLSATNTKAISSSSPKNYGIIGTADCSGAAGFMFSPAAIGVAGIAKNDNFTADGTAIGGYFEAQSPTATRYAIQLLDGTEGAGKFLKSITAEGRANWANITSADVSGVVGGTGTINTLSKWTGTNTLGDSPLLESGSCLGLGILPNPVINRFGMLGGTRNTLAVYNVNNSSASNAAGIRVLNNEDNNDFDAPIAAGDWNCGILTECRSSVNNTNIGIISLANKTTTLTNIGGYFQATGSSTNNYAIRLKDPSSGTGKALVSIDADGTGKWDKITSSYTTGATIGPIAIPISGGTLTLTFTNGICTAATTSFF